MDVAVRPVISQQMCSVRTHITDRQSQVVPKFLLYLQAPSLHHGIVCWLDIRSNVGGVEWVAALRGELEGYRRRG